MASIAWQCGIYYDECLPVIILEVAHIAGLQHGYSLGLPTAAFERFRKNLVNRTLHDFRRNVGEAMD